MHPGLCKVLSLLSVRRDFVGLWAGNVPVPIPIVPRCPLRRRPRGLTKQGSLMTRLARNEDNL